jgi:hypothetical protein
MRLCGPRNNTLDDVDGDRFDTQATHIGTTMRRFAGWFDAGDPLGSGPGVRRRPDVPPWA